MAKHCEHWYWDLNARHNYRICKFCLKTQFNYTGRWKDRMTFEQLVYKYTPLDGHTFIPRIKVEGCQLFEFQCYESWGSAIKVTINDIEYGPYKNVNQADAGIQREIGKNLMALMKV